MNEKEIRRWYREHGLEYLPGDWDRRGGTGESASYQPVTPERAPEFGASRSTSKKIHPLSDDRLVYEEAMSASEQTSLPGGVGGTHFQSRFHALWAAQRTPEDREEVEAMEEFWFPYLHMLPVPKANILWQVMNARLTYEQIGEARGTSRQAAHDAVRTATRDLLRLVAADEPRFVPHADKRRRDYEGEEAAALHVLNRYWKGRFGHNYIEED